MVYNIGGTTTATVDYFFTSLVPNYEWLHSGSVQEFFDLTESYKDSYNPDIEYIDTEYEVKFLPELSKYIINGFGEI